MGVSKNRGETPKMDDLQWKTPIKMDDFGGETPLFSENFGNIHITVIKAVTSIYLSLNNIHGAFLLGINHLFFFVVPKSEIYPYGPVMKGHYH